jgi:4-amino-4-deoxy-L-arabinose transferase-like glycosyltransferase
MNRFTFSLLLLIVVLFYFSTLGMMPLLEPDEARYAEIPREMLATGDLITPHLNGVVYLEKPPLFYWGNALFMRLFGESDFSARLFTTLVAVIGIVLTYWMGTVLAGRRTGQLSALVLSSSLYYYIVGRLNVPDISLAVFLIIATFPAYLYLSKIRENKGYLYLSYAGAGLAFLTKGLVGVVFPVAILFITLLLTRRQCDFRRAFSFRGLSLFLALVLPWLAAVQKKNPDFLWFFFVHEHFLRYTTPIHGRSEPFWYFVPILAGGFIPWIMLLPRMVTSLRQKIQHFLSREVLVFLLTWALFVLVFFSLSHSKLATYISPIFPPLAILFGRGLDLWMERDNEAGVSRLPFAFAALLAGAAILLDFLAQPASAVQSPFPFLSEISLQQEKWIHYAFPSLAILLLWGAVPLFLRRLGVKKVILLYFLFFSIFLSLLQRPAALFLGSYKSVKELSQVISASAQPGDIVAQYGEYMQGIPFYTKRRTILVERMGELRFGAERAKDRDQYFLKDAEFLRLWRSKERVFCVFEHDQMPFIQNRFPDHQLLHWSEAGILIVNRL